MNVTINTQRALTFITLFLLFSQTAQATSNLCPIATPHAYTNNLNVSSKYAPNDLTRSTEIEIDQESLFIQKQLNSFSAGIVYFSDYYVHYRDDERGKVGLKCIHNWLSDWASNDAITTYTTSPTGKALRSWTLSSISSALLKVKFFAGNKWALTPTESAWLRRLAEHVLFDYFGRTNNIPDRINNHDYWAAWSTTATGILIENRDFSDWGYIVFKHAVKQSVSDNLTQTAYLPNELGRGSLGIHYSNFAVTPLVMLSIYLPQLGYSLNLQDQQTLSDLASFSSLSILSPNSISHLTSVEQKTPSPAILSWSLPFRHNNENHLLVNRLLGKYGHLINGHNQIGGKIKTLYPFDSE